MRAFPCTVWLIHLSCWCSLQVISIRAKIFQLV
jgi:hypothetical protein